MRHDKLVAELWHPTSNEGGSGLLVSDGWVLTAHHVIGDVGKPSLKNDLVEVRLQGDWLLDNKSWYRYRVYWSSPDLDLALLKRDVDESLSETSTSPLQCAKLADNELFENCHCIGFPRINQADNKNDTASVRGNIDTANLQRHHTMSMQVTSQSAKQESGWKGLSGSVLLYDDYIVGVVVQVATLFQDNVILLCPIEELFNHPDFDELSLSGLMLPPLVTYSNKSTQIDPSNQDDLPELVCFLDRSAHVNSFRFLLSELKNNPGSHNSFICAVFGEKKHEHYALIDRFQRDTLPSIFDHDPAYQEISPLDFPTKIRNVDAEFKKLQQRLYSKLNIIGEPNKLIETFNSGDTPRIFYTFIYGDDFGAEHNELLTKWTQFWQELGDQPLMCVVGLVVCLCTDEIDEPKPSGSWWKFWDKKDRPSLKDFQFQDANDNCETLELDYCRDQHINEWIRFLDSSTHYNWSVQYLKPIAHGFYGQEKIAVKEVKTAIIHSLENTP